MPYNKATVSGQESTWIARRSSAMSLCFCSGANIYHCSFRQWWRHDHWGSIATFAFTTVEVNKKHKYICVVAHNMNRIAWKWWWDGMLCDDDVSFFMCGAEIMLFNPHTTEYLPWNIADTGNSQSVLLCCTDVVAGVKKAFCKHSIQLNLVLHVG